MPEDGSAQASPSRRAGDWSTYRKTARREPRPSWFVVNVRQTEGPGGAGALVGVAAIGARGLQPLARGRAGVAAGDCLCRVLDVEAVDDFVDAGDAVDRRQ